MIDGEVKWLVEKEAVVLLLNEYDCSV